MDNKKDYIEKIVIVLIFVIILGVILFFFFKEFFKSQNKQELYSVGIKGEDIDISFDKDIYEYNIVVDKDVIEIVCDSNVSIDGCNEVIDLRDKDVYIHKINVFIGNKKYIYNFNIKKNVDVKDNENREKFYIKSIDGNSTNWTNKDIVLKVEMSKKDQYLYSFDGGINWQESNKFTVKGNGSFTIVVKDYNGVVTKSKVVDVNKIDKNAPIVTVNKTNATKKEVLLEVNASDELSGVDSISFNGGEFITNNKYKVTSVGSYYFQVKDKAGNVSNKKYIEIKKEDFVVDDTIKKEKTFTVTLKGNGTTVLKDVVSCSTTADKCKVILPAIVTKATIIGWNSDPNATTATYKDGQQITVDRDLTLYVISKRTLTATFKNPENATNAANPVSCDVYNDNKNCNIVLPAFNKSGHFNSYWGTDSIVSSNLRGTKWSWEYFNQVGHSYSLSKDTTFYPNFNHFHYDLDSNYMKYRSINISTSISIGKTIFEFENGIPKEVINNFLSSMDNAYNVFPWLFSSGKVFVMTEQTYSNYSIAYGLTHNSYSLYGGDSHFTIDLKYDASGVVVKNAIDVNAALHELAHAWDSYYSFKMNSERISLLSDFDIFYKSIDSKLYIDSNGSKISKTETFAGMFTTYYWHVLAKDKSKPFYGLKNGITLNSTELESLKRFMDKYINIATNSYKK